MFLGVSKSLGLVVLVAAGLQKCRQRSEVGFGVQFLDCRWKYGPENGGSCLWCLKWEHAVWEVGRAMGWGVGYQSKSGRSRYRPKGRWSSESTGQISRLLGLLGSQHAEGIKVWVSHLGFLGWSKPLERKEGTSVGWGVECRSAIAVQMWL